jgi:hypothetical protein
LVAPSRGLEGSKRQNVSHVNSYFKFANIEAATCSFRGC